MAFGPSTTGVQQAILTLLQGRDPSPLAPVPAGPLTPPGGPLLSPPGPAPEPAPIAPLPARDEALIEQLTGPRPVAPAVEPTALIVQIARALQGFGAGVQGQGPQFLAQLQEQRERPQREFRAATEAFESRRRRAVEIAEDKRQREQAEIQRRADEQSRRDFDLYVQRSGITDKMALQQMEQGFELERDARRAEAERRETERRERIQQERDAKQIENQYFGLSKNRALSKELGLYWSGLKDSLSPAAAALDKRMQGIGDVTMRRRAGLGDGGGRGASNAAMKAYDDFNSALQAVIAASQRGDVRAERQHRARLDRVFGALSRFPGQIEAGIGTGGWPYAKLRNAPAPTATQGQQPQAQPQSDPLGIR
jgi:hypothetical protein